MLVICFRIERIREKLRAAHPDADKIVETVVREGYRMSDSSDELAAKLA